MEHLHHITRLTRHHHKQDAYLVRVTKHGRKMRRYFHLRDYDTEQEALTAALKYRAKACALLGVTPPEQKRVQDLASAAALLPPEDRAELAKTLITTIITQ